MSCVDKIGHAHKILSDIISINKKSQICLNISYFLNLFSNKLIRIHLYTNNVNVINIRIFPSSQYVNILNLLLK